MNRLLRYIDSVEKDIDDLLPIKPYKLSEIQKQFIDTHISFDKLREHELSSLFYEYGLKFLEIKKIITEIKLFLLQIETEDLR